MKRVPWVSHLAYIVSMTGVIASLMLVRGEIKRKGVCCAWHIGDPKAFLKKMSDRGIQLLEKIEMPLY